LVVIASPPTRGTDVRDRCSARQQHTDDEFKRSIQDDVGIKPEWAAEAFSDVDEDVRQSIARIKASPFIPHKDSVRGFVYDVTTGALREIT
jgi:carbonic anhydrase